MIRTFFIKRKPFQMHVPLFFAPAKLERSSFVEGLFVKKFICGKFVSGKFICEKFVCEKFTNFVNN